MSHIRYHIAFRDGVVGNISACHADARGSIPRRGAPYVHIFNLNDTLAEWLRRQPAKLLRSACAGSNPAGVVQIHIAFEVPVAQRIRRVTTNHEIAGSNPVGDKFVCLGSMV